MKKLFITLPLLFLLGCLTNDHNGNTILKRAPLSNKPELMSSKVSNREIAENSSNYGEMSEATGKGVGYEIVSNTFIGTKTNNRRMCKIVVDPTITQQQIRPLAEKIIKDITSLHQDIDEITMYLYSDRTVLNQAYDIAMVDWGYPENDGSNLPLTAC